MQHPHADVVVVDPDDPKDFTYLTRAFYNEQLDRWYLLPNWLSVIPKGPTCKSPHPSLHPAVQFEGEVQPCRDSWHCVPCPVVEYEFDRYRNGQLMAQGARVEARDMSEALRKAVKLFRESPGDTFKFRPKQ